MSNVVRGSRKKLSWRFHKIIILKWHLLTYLSKLMYSTFSFKLTVFFNAISCGNETTLPNIETVGI